MGILCGGIGLVTSLSLIMAQIFGMEQIQNLEKAIAKYPSIDNLLNTLQKKTQVKKIYLIYGIASCVVTWLMFGYGAQLLCGAIGFVYPAYCSIKALESNDKNDDTQWLVYWVVFALFSVVDFFSEIVVGWVPFYWLGKCVFLIWCMSPLDGASLIYRKIVLPFFIKNQSRIDNVLNRGREQLAGVSDKVVSSAARIATEAAESK